MNKIFSKTGLPIFLLFMFTFWGCSKSSKAPDGRKSIESIITEQSNGSIELIKFEKTNGVKSTFGKEYYELEYSALIEFQAECWQVDGYADFVVFNSEKKARRSLIATDFGRVPKHYNKGDQITTTGVMTFEKTENGWRLTDD